VAVSVAAALFFNLQIAGVVTIADRLGTEIIFASVAAFLAGLIAALWSNARPLGPVASVLTSILAATLLVWLQVSHGGVLPQELVVLLGLGFALMVAAHLRRGALVESFWFFNLQLGSAVAMASVALLIVCNGLSLLLASFRYLFDVPIPSTIYGHIWVTGATVIGPALAESVLPTGKPRLLFRFGGVPVAMAAGGSVDFCSRNRRGRH